MISSFAAILSNCFNCVHGQSYDGFGFPDQLTEMLDLSSSAAAPLEYNTIENAGHQIEKP